MKAASSAKAGKHRTTGGSPWIQRHVALLFVLPTVKIIDVPPFEQRDREAARLLRRSVIHPQLLPPAPDVDAALAERDSVAVNPLMGVAHVGRCRSRRRARSCAATGTPPRSCPGPRRSPPTGTEARPSCSTSDRASRIRSIYSFLPCSFIWAAPEHEMRFFRSRAQARAAAEASRLDVLLHAGSICAWTILPFRPVEALSKR